MSTAAGSGRILVIGDVMTDVIVLPAPPRVPPAVLARMPPLSMISVLPESIATDAEPLLNSNELTMKLSVTEAAPLRRTLADAVMLVAYSPAASTRIPTPLSQVAKPPAPSPPATLSTRM